MRILSPNAIRASKDRRIPVVQPEIVVGSDFDPGVGANGRPRCSDAPTARTAQDVRRDQLPGLGNSTARRGSDSDPPRPPSGRARPWSCFVLSLGANRALSVALGGGKEKGEGARKSRSLLLDLAPHRSVLLGQISLWSPSQAGCRGFEPRCPLHLLPPLTAARVSLFSMPAQGSGGSGPTPTTPPEWQKRRSAAGSLLTVSLTVLWSHEQHEDSQSRKAGRDGRAASNLWRRC